MIERAVSSLVPGVYGKANRTQLHFDDWMMTVTALRCGGQAGDEACSDFSQYTLEVHCGEMVAFIHNDMAIVGHQIIHFILAHDTLDHGNVELAVGFTLATTNSSDVTGIQSKKQGELRNPLIEQRLTMYQDQGITLPFANQPGSDDGFADTWWCNEDTDIMFSQCIDVSSPLKRTSSGTPGWRWSSIVSALP